MKKRIAFSITMAAALVVVLGMVSFAGAHPPMWGDRAMTPDQYAAMQEAYAELDRRVQPLRQQMYAKQAELDALYYSNAPQNTPQEQSLVKEINALDSKIYEAYANMRNQMSDKGIPVYGGGMPGYGRGYGHGYGRGYGHGCGWGRGW